MAGHRSVLLDQAVGALVTDPDGIYVDGTFGRGGHSREILQRLTGKGRLVVFDKDPAAIETARALSVRDRRVTARHASFAELEAVTSELGCRGKVQGVLLDLGVSSPQLDDARRGFSFLKDGPLDMRMNPQEGISLKNWLAAAPEEEIASVIHRYGEERFSRRMARAIVRERKTRAITSTLQLAEIIKRANPSWEKTRHPATRAFQAFRIFINHELEDLESALYQMPGVLAPGGRMVVISFHSLEDGMVKRFIREQERGDTFPRGVPVTWSQLHPRMKRVGRALKVSREEAMENVRARSAVMRVAEKIGREGI